MRAPKDTYPYDVIDPRGRRSFYSFATHHANLLDEHRVARRELLVQTRHEGLEDHSSCHPVCVDAALGSATPPDSLVELCRRKIEVFHRLAHRYGSNGRRVDSEAFGADTYALAADHFAGRAARTKDLESRRWLNATMKALDVAAFLCDELTRSADEPLRRAITVELSMVARLSARNSGTQ